MVSGRLGTIWTAEPEMVEGSTYLLRLGPRSGVPGLDRLQSAAYELVLEGESYRRRQKPVLGPIDPPPPSPRSSRRRR